ncbi:hypothetical protein PM082_015181 [Marasmius tenuissimus]|nr:hypothetical protein PM082_015181 [Marasmius tenuissimus]
MEESAAQREDEDVVDNGGAGDGGGVAATSVVKLGIQQLDHPSLVNSIQRPEISTSPALDLLTLFEALRIAIAFALTIASKHRSHHHDEIDILSPRNWAWALPAFRSIFHHRFGPEDTPIGNDEHPNRIIVIESTHAFGQLTSTTRRSPEVVGRPSNISDGSRRGQAWT